MSQLASKAKRTRGFTLIEILVVIGIIAVLAAIVIIAINPARQFAQARNAQRTSDVSVLLNAIGQNLADNKGTFTCPGATITSTAKNIGTTAGATFVDLSCLVPAYFPAMVTDPTGGALTDTKYTVSVDTNGRYTVCAPNAAEPAITPTPAPICLTR
jgi:type IV pilus assembly protein PilA